MSCPTRQKHEGCIREAHRATPTAYKLRAWQRLQRTTTAAMHQQHACQVSPYADVMTTYGNDHSVGDAMTTWAQASHRSSGPLWINNTNGNDQ